jgi:hypothetical protein
MPRIRKEPNCQPGAPGTITASTSDGLIAILRWELKRGNYPDLDFLPGPAKVVPTGRREYMLFMLLLYKRPRR